MWNLEKRHKNRKGLLEEMREIREGKGGANIIKVCYIHAQ
jgi:hypothetical protein